MLTLLMMRHGKSDWDADHAGDHERPLNQRGMRSALVVGRVLADRGMVPGKVISSTAVRARTTAEMAAEAGAWGSEIVFDPSLYDTGPAGVLEVAASGHDVDRLMLVGHQPTWSELVELLTETSVDLKTADVAVIGTGISSWGELSPGVGELVEVIRCRHFLGSQWDDR